MSTFYSDITNEAEALVQLRTYLHQMHEEELLDCSGTELQFSKTIQELLEVKGDASFREEAKALANQQTLAFELEDFDGLDIPEGRHGLIDLSEIKYRVKMSHSQVLVEYLAILHDLLTNLKGSGELDEERTMQVQEELFLAYRDQEESFTLQCVRKELPEGVEVDESLLKECYHDAVMMWQLEHGTSEGFDPREIAEDTVVLYLQAV